MAKKATPQEPKAEPERRRPSAAEAKFGARVLSRLMNVINEEMEWGPDENKNTNAAVVLSTLPILVAECAAAYVQDGEEMRWLREVERMTQSYYIGAKRQQQAEEAKLN